jgi:hypothetical protein
MVRSWMRPGTVFVLLTLLLILIAAGIVFIVQLLSVQA